MLFSSKRVVRSHTFTVSAVPERVFELLCPVREYDWIPFWKCRLLHSRSGLAEKDCVFTTFFLHRGREVWTCHRHEPPRAVGYVHMGGCRVACLEVELTPEGEGTRLEWTTTLTGLGWRGNRRIEKMDEATYAREVGALGAMLDHYLQTGTCLPSTEARRLFKGR